MWPQGVRARAAKSLPEVLLFFLDEGLKESVDSDRHMKHVETILKEWPPLLAHVGTGAIDSIEVLNDAAI